VGPSQLYLLGKTAWVGINALGGVRKSNMVPFSEQGERNAVKYSSLGKLYRDVFTPEFMKRECP